VPADVDAGRVFYSLSQDRHGRLWLGSNRGLVRFDPDASPERAFRTYDPGDGTGNWEFNRRARFRDGDGRLYLGGMTGVTVFAPDAVRADLRPPRAMLDRMRILGAGGEREDSLVGVERLRLAPGDLALELSFTTPLFTRGDRARFRYRLLDFDPDWRVAGEERSARYTNLPPGDYRFEVEAANADGVWSAAPGTLALRVVPPFYATWWFRGLALLALLSLLALAYRLRVRHLLALQRMRLDIAADLHDELGSELAAIGVGAAMVARGRGLEEGERRRLEGVRSSAETVMQSLRDIVWYVNPDKDRTDALVERMRRHAGSVLGDLCWRFETEGMTHNLPLDMLLRRQVYLIFREALNNLVRHTAARSVRIAIAIDGTRVEMAIDDDGRGFDPARPGGDGSGLANMRRRAAAIAATLDIDSAPGHGTRIRLGLDMTHSRRGRRRPGGSG
jgi:signal transduction histidine kinase